MQKLIKYSIFEMYWNNYKCLHSVKVCYTIILVRVVCHDQFNDAIACSIGLFTIIWPESDRKITLSWFLTVKLTSLLKLLAFYEFITRRVVSTNHQRPTTWPATKSDQLAFDSLLRRLCASTVRRCTRVPDVLRSVTSFAQISIISTYSNSFLGCNSWKFNYIVIYKVKDRNH